MIKKHTVIVILIAIMISAGIWIKGYNKNKETKKSKSVKALIFEGSEGWGYDILVNDSLFIHQEYVPVISGKHGFAKKEQAEKTANLIINKIKTGQIPVITRFELEKIISVNEYPPDGQGILKFK